MNAKISNRKNDVPADGWYQIEVSGEHPAGEGLVQVIDENSLHLILNAFRSEMEQDDDHAGILVDADHLSHDLANDTAALAWLREMDIRNGQLWGRLDLTDLGEAAVKGKRYKFFSTEYSGSDLQDLGNGRVRPKRLAGLAFTNRPNNRGGKPISNRDKTEPLKTESMKPIAEKLGLPADADEAAILAKIATLMSSEATAKADVQNRAAEVTTLQAETKRLGGLLVDSDIASFADVIESAEDAKPFFISNRDGAIKMFTGMRKKLGDGGGGKTAKQPLYNRATATAPDGNKFSAAEDDKVESQRLALVATIKNREKCDHGTAWEIAKGEKPELF